MRNSSDNPRRKSPTKAGLSRERRDLLFTNNRNLRINFHNTKIFVKIPSKGGFAFNPDSEWHVEAFASLEGDLASDDIKELRDINK